MSRQRQSSAGASLEFDRREVIDLGAAWIALGLAFAIFFAGGISPFLSDGPIRWLAICMTTAGIGFLLHELAHKAVAVHFDVPAAFRAEYGMLLIAIAAAAGGFLFAAPGAVYHPATTTRRQQGLIALAGPVTNVILAFGFIPVVFLVPGRLGVLGVAINAFLAAFNMFPWGPLDGKSVYDWSKSVFAAAFLATVTIAVIALFVFVL